MNTASPSGKPVRGQAKRPPIRPAGLGWAQIAVLMSAALLAWLAVRINLAEYFAQERTPHAVRQALVWHAAQPEALTDQVMRQGPGADSGDPVLAQAVRANPAEGRLFAALALRAETAKAPEYAARAMQMATRLAPQRTDVRLAAYHFWLRRGDLVRALQDVNVALTREPELGDRLFPQLTRLLAHRQADAGFAGLLKTSVPWWPAYFAHLSRQSLNVEAIRTLYAMQRQGPNEITEGQLKAYIDRLMRDGRWLDAYVTWMNSVPADQLVFSGEVHNGGFEEPTRNFGFEWTEQPVQGVLVGFDPTYGTTGAQALHIVFQGGKARWRNFFQYLMLGPGEYSLRGRVRIDSLHTEEGVQWSITCQGSNQTLAASERFKGSDQWRHFQTGFSVPADCPVQQLRLELVGRASLDFAAEGQIWFDDIGILRN